jgi:hypothetical protein
LARVIGLTTTSSCSGTGSISARKGSPFNSAQTELLRRVEQWIAEKSAEPGLLEYFANDIEESAQKVLAEMPAHHS